MAFWVYVLMKEAILGFGNLVRGSIFFGKFGFLLFGVCLFVFILGYVRFECKFISSVGLVFCF
jgi:hypothetical protein